MLNEQSKNLWEEVKKAKVNIGLDGIVATLMQTLETEEALYVAETLIHRIQD